MKELLEEGVTVCLGQDDISDDYYPFGRNNMLEVAKDQPTFEFHDTKGTMVGFYTPSFMSSLSVPGVHLHFLTDDRASGGHLLECRPRKVKVELEYLYTIELSLPSNLDYLTWDFQRDIGMDLDKAEK